MSARLRLQIVGDTRLYCEGLAHLLRLYEAFTIVAVAYTTLEALDYLGSTSPDIVLVDLGMKDGLEMIRAIARRQPRSQVVALGVDEDLETILLCAEAGAAGYVSRAASLEDLVAVLHSASQGELRCSAKIAGTLFRRIAVLAASVTENEQAAVDNLTVRESEIADLIALRLSNKEIAGRLGIECATVKNHVHNILEKLRLRRRQEIAARGRVGGCFRGI